jgi:hypothetical protein
MKGFKDEELNKVVRATLLLGIEQLKKEKWEGGAPSACDLEEYTVNTLAAPNMPAQMTRDTFHL